MITKAKYINEKISWQDITTGAEIYEPATSLLVETDDCKHCMLCVLYCPDSSIPVKHNKRRDFDLVHCKGCGICAKVCPFNAIEFVKEDK